MAISRMQEPRQLYGLGSLVRKITRPIKKAVKGVGKIAKSPLGKMALLAAAGYGLGAVGPGGFDKARMLSRLGLGSLTTGTTLPGPTTSPSFLSTLNPFGSNFSLKNLGITSAAAGALLPFVAPNLFAPKEEEDMEEIDYTIQPEGITSIVEQAKDYYRMGGGGNLEYMPRSDFVRRSFFAAQGGLADEEDDKEFDRNLTGIMRTRRQKGGRIGFNMGGAQFTSGDNISPGTDKIGNIRDDNPFTGGGGDGPPSIINLPTKDKSTELLTFDEYTGKPMTYADVAAANKFLNFVKTQGGYTMGEDTEADALFNAYQTATGRDTFMKDATVDSVTNMRTTDIDGDTTSFMDRTSTITDNPTGRMRKSLVVETPTNFTQRFITPTGIRENDVLQKFGAPQSLSVDPYRVGAEGGGLMNLGGLEMDFRAKGGFVPIGSKEKADDVPARLSKNEFVMTADAVRGAGGGSIERGAQKMYNTMKELESRVV